VEIIQKLSSKINRAARRNCYLSAPDGAHYLGSRSSSEKDSANRTQSSLLELLRCSLSYVNHSKSKQNQTEDSDSAPKGTLMRSARFAWKLLNFILLFLAMAMLKQA